MAPCSVKHGNIQYCFECPEHPCRHYEGFDSYDTLVLHRNQRKDIQKAKEIGIDAYHDEQRKKKKILNRLLSEYDDGTRDVFYCLAVNMLELKDLEDVLKNADDAVGLSSLKEKAAFVEKELNSCAERNNTPLVLRR